MGYPCDKNFSQKIGRTRSFISGPADPFHNPHMVWCHMCTKNFFVKTKGTVEILRHHRTEKHLRRDQQWRYEHLKSVNTVTGKVQHMVRGRNGKILSKIEQAQELPKYILTELIDIGAMFPFTRTTSKEVLLHLEPPFTGQNSDMSHWRLHPKSRLPCLASTFEVASGVFY